MHFRLIPLTLTVVVMTAAVSAAAGPDDRLESLRKDLFYLAGEECEGRGLETQGLQKAGEYIAEAFRQAGLKPGGGKDSYFQPFTVWGPPKLGSPNTLGLRGPNDRKLDLKYGEDFVPTGMALSGKTAAGVVFAGYGITTADGKYDDYAGLAVTGKWVIILRKSPRAGDHGSPTAAYQGVIEKVQNAVEHGAAGVILVNHRSDGAKDVLMDLGYAANEPVDIPVVHVKRVVVEKLLATRDRKLLDLEEAIDRDLKPRSFELKGWRAEAELTLERVALPTRNVIGVLEGNGPMADETIVIGAHYDHLGKGERGTALGAKGKGLVHYGADDNASGTTGLIELARRFARQKDRTGRRLVFVAFSGEEQGLFGSKHYVKRPPFPLAKTVFMLNMDMIGRVSRVFEPAPLAKVSAVGGVAPAVAVPGAVPQRDRLVVYGTGTAEGLDRLVEETNQTLDFHLLKVPGGTGPSDHDSFYRKRIPVLFLFTGTHRDYHRPSDTPEKINLAGLKKVVDLAETVIGSIATTTTRPRYLVTAGGWHDPTAETPTVARPQAPRLGIMPGNYEAKSGGVLVDDVSPGGAAEKAGLRANDVIIEIAGKPIKNINDYMVVMSGQKPGVPIEVVILRTDRKMTVKVTPLP